MRSEVACGRCRAWPASPSGCRLCARPSTKQGQSAGEAGFTLDRVQAQGRDRVDITIATARPTALLGWIAALEGQGIAVDKALLSPSGATGTVSAQLGFARAGKGT